MTQLHSLYVGSLWKAIWLARRREWPPSRISDWWWNGVKRIRTGRCTEFETDVHVCLRPHRGLNWDKLSCKKMFQKAKDFENINVQVSQIGRYFPCNSAFQMLTNCSTLYAFFESNLRLPWMNSWQPKPSWNAGKHLKHSFAPNKMVPKKRKRWYTSSQQPSYVMKIESLCFIG